MADTPGSEIVPLFISVPDAARLLGISERTCWRLVADKKIVSAKIGDSRRISLEALRHYADRIVADEARGESA